MYDANSNDVVTCQPWSGSLLLFFFIFFVVLVFCDFFTSNGLNFVVASSSAHLLGLNSLSLLC
jgi:hypothetical protein